MVNTKNSLCLNKFGTMLRFRSEVIASEHLEATHNCSVVQGEN